MENKDFNLLIKNLDSLINRCVKLKEDVEKVQLKDKSVSDYNKAIETASSLQGEQDKALRGDLYHILGMGNLTVTQQAKFISKIKEVLDTRSMIKFVASQPKVNLGKQSSSSDYVCSLLSGKKLISQN